MTKAKSKQKQQATPKPTRKELEAIANSDALALAQLIYELYKRQQSS